VQLEVRLFTGLKCRNEALEVLGQNTFILRVEEGMSIEQLIQYLQLDTSDTLIGIINGRVEKHDLILKDQDRVGIFPPVGGG
jgi:molybdopterin synthase sulfur carrier subunit